MNSNTLVLDLEEMEDLRDAAEARLAAIEAANEERVPWIVVQRMHRGENPIMVWRELRRLTREELAERAKVAPGVISAAESGEAVPSIGVYRSIARALDVMIDNLVAWSPD